MTSHVQIPDYQVHDSVTLDPERTALLVGKIATVNSLEPEGSG